MSIVITQQSLLPIRRDKQIIAGNSTSSGGGGYSGGGGGGGTTYIAGFNIDISGTTISVVDAPSFAGNVTAPIFIEGSTCLALKYLPICNPIACGTLCAPIACFGTCSKTPIACSTSCSVSVVDCATTCSVTPVACGSISVNTPVLNSSTCICGVNMIMACDINSPVFISGFAGQGWKLDNNSGTSFDLEVDNLRVRNVLTAYELEINEIQSVNGGLIISSANGIPYSVVGTRFYFDTDGGNSAIQFVVNDYIRAQIWTGSGIGSYLGIVTNVHQSATLGDAYIDATTISGSPWDKMKAVQVGNSSNVSRQNIIYLTASDSCNPYIDMLSGVNAGTFAGHNRVRIGNLCGISDAAFGGALSGYGLYADNIYLKGAIVISAGCGYTNLCDKPLSLSAINITEANKLAGIAAGATNISNTNQLVDGANLGGTATWNSIAAVPSYLGGPGSAGLYMGSCYMGYYNGSAWQTYIDCNGNVQFQGVSSFGTTSCSGDNIHLMGASISDDSYCGDCGTIYINYTGYHGSCDYTRNLIVGNGKGANGLMAYFDGTNKRIGFVNNIAPDSTFMVGTHNGAGLKINCGESGNNFIYGTLTSNSTITATNFILSSDERLKTNIQSLSIAPVNVDYKQFNLCNDIEQPRYGVIAQELQLHNPELVRTDENGMLSVSYFDLFAKEISALKCQVKELQHDLNYYRNYNDIK